MSYIHDSNNNGPIKPSTGAQSQLEKLRGDLLTKREASVEQGLVEDITMIDAALSQVENALEQVNLENKINSSQVRLGQVRESSTDAMQEAAEADGVITEAEAEAIKRIRGVIGQRLEPGEQIKTLEAYNSYMKDNIGGLNELVALKA